MVTSNLVDNKTGQVLQNVTYNAVPEGYSVQGQTPTPTVNTPAPAPAAPTGGAMVNNSQPAVPNTPVQAPAAPTTTSTGQGAPVGYSSPVNPSPTTTTAGSNTSQTSLDVYQKKLADIQVATDDMNRNFANLMGQFQNGTVPLNAYQAAQVAATQASFNALIQKQLLANKNYEGGVGVQNENMGLSRYSPILAAGNVFAAVSEGNAKIADLNSKMALAVSTMQQGFQESNYKQVKEAYDTLAAAQKEKTAQVEKMYQAAKAQEDKVKLDAQEQTVRAANAVLYDPNLSMNEKQEKIASLIVTGNLNSEQVSKLQTAVHQVLQDSKADTKVVDYGNGQALIDSQTGRVIQVYKEKLTKEQQDEATARASAIKQIPGLKDTIKSIQGLLDTGSYKKVVGTFGLGRTPILSGLTGEAQNASATIKQLTSQQVLDTLVNLKKSGGTLGALSDAEGALLRSAATKIGTWEIKDKNGLGTGRYDASESDFATELETIQRLTQRAINNALGVSADNPLGIDMVGLSKDGTSLTADPLNLGI